jgi:hypothetical protein
MEDRAKHANHKFAHQYHKITAQFTDYTKHKNMTFYNSHKSLWFIVHLITHAHNTRIFMETGIEVRQKRHPSTEYHRA